MNNPYAPPGARVADTQSPAHMERPRQIVTVIWLAVLNYALGLVGLAASWSYYSKLQPLGFMIAGQLISAAIFFWIYYKIYQGRNWARILLLILCILGAVMAIVGSFTTSALGTPPLTIQILTFVGLALNAYGLWLLFSSPGREWFRRSE